MKNSHIFVSNRKFDVICLGRLAVDLYAQQVGARLEDVTSFAKYLGGSSANIAFGCARLGLKSAMLTRVGDDHMGRFLTESLRREGCDTSHVTIDHEHLTALVLLGLKDRETFPLVFYRDHCADMAIHLTDFNEDFIASSRTLLITGTHFSTAQVHRVSLQAVEFARLNHVRTILDIDYRPVLWGLVGKADGETRYISNENVTRHLQEILPLFDLIVGTEEEFCIAGGSSNLLLALKAVREKAHATLVIKRGELGCSILEGAMPETIDAIPTFRGTPVEVLNVLGAGDAFMAGFLSGWVRGHSYDICAEHANACGAFVVSRHACAPAMPTPAELDYFLTIAKNEPERMRRPDLDPTLVRLHRVTVPRPVWDELFVFAFDHRNQYFELAQKAGASETRLPILKNLLVQAVTEVEQTPHCKGHIGILCDSCYGQDALNAATGRGWWIGRPVELPGSNPLVFEGGRSIGTTLISWPNEHIVKCLVFYHPDQPIEHRLEQEAQMRALYDSVQASGHELMIELIPPKDLPSAEDTILRCLTRFYNLGIFPEWWKLESLPEETWPAIDQLITERDIHCRGVMLLGLNASMDSLAKGFRATRSSSTCKGFAVGRTIFEAPSLAWLSEQIDDRTLIDQIKKNFETLITLWRHARKLSTTNS